MRCTNCGYEFEKGIYCPNCKTTQNFYTKPKMNTLAVVGFALSFIIPLAGLIVSFIAYRDVIEKKQDGKSFAIAGMAYGGTLTLITLLTTIITLVITFAIVAIPFTEILGELYVL